jgi:hypothetical protein
VRRQSGAGGTLLALRLLEEKESWDCQVTVADAVRAVLRAQREDVHGGYAA